MPQVHIDYDIIANRVRSGTIDYDALAANVRTRLPAQIVPQSPVTSADTAFGALRNMAATAAETIGGTPTIAGTAKGLAKTLAGLAFLPGMSQDQVSGPIDPLGDIKDLYKSTIGRIVGGVQTGDPYEISGGVGATAPYYPLVRAGAGIGAKAITPNPESLLLRAAENRSPSAPSLPESAVSIAFPRTGRLVGEDGQPYRNLKASIQERLAQAISNKQMPPTFSELPAVEQNAPQPPLSQRTGLPNVPAPSADISLTQQGPYTSPAPKQPPRNLGNEQFLESLRNAPTEVPNLGSPEAINRWMNVPAKQVMRGANPGARVLEEKLVSPNDLSGTQIKIGFALKDAEGVLQRQLEAAGEKGITIDATKAVNDAVRQARGGIGTPSDPVVKAQLQQVREDIADQYPNLKTMTPLEAQALKRQLKVKFGGPSTPLNDALQQLWVDMNGLIKDAIPEIAPVQSRWQDLYIGNKSIGTAIAKEKVGMKPVDVKALTEKSAKARKP